MNDSVFRIFAGTLGSYKSYNGVLEMIETLKNGGRVFTNIELVWERMKLLVEDEYRIILDDKQYVHISHENAASFVTFLTKGTMDKPNRLVIDEAGLHHNSKRHKIADEKVQEMIAHARKLHIDTIFIAHSFDHVTKQVRDCAQSVVWFRDWQKIKFLGFKCPIPVYSFEEVDARKPKLKYNSDIKWKDKRIYKVYKSHDVQSETASAIPDSPEINIVKLDEEKKSRPIRAIVRKSLFAGLMLGVGHMLWADSGSDSNSDQEAAQAARESVRVKPAANPQPEQTANTNEVNTYYQLSVMGQPIVAKGFGTGTNTRLLVCKYQHMKVYMSDGRIITGLDPDLHGVRMADRTVYYGGKVYQYQPIRQAAQEPSNEAEAPKGFFGL